MILLLHLRLLLSDSVTRWGYRQGALGPMVIMGEVAYYY